MVEWVKKLNDELGLFMYLLFEVKFYVFIFKLLKNIICIGKNYRDYVIEMGSEVDILEYLMVFIKLLVMVIGYGDIVISYEEVIF